MLALVAKQAASERQSKGMGGMCAATTYAGTFRQCAFELASAALQRYVRRVAAQLYGDTAKNEDALQKLVDLKDNHIFNSLRSLCAPGAPPPLRLRPFLTPDYPCTQDQDPCLLEPLRHPLRRVTGVANRLRRWPCCGERPLYARSRLGRPCWKHVGT